MGAQGRDALRGCQGCQVPVVPVCLEGIFPFSRPASMWLELAARLQGERAAGFLRSVSVLNL